MTIRCLAVTFPPESVETGSVYDSLVPYPTKRRASLYNLNLLEDGTTLELVQVEGDKTEIVTELESRENLIKYDIFSSNEQVHYIYQHVEQDEQLLSLLSLLREHRLLIDFPISYSDHGVTVRLVGEEEMIQRAFDQLPQKIRQELEIESVQEYSPEPRGLRQILTARQRQVLETAVKVGYYTDPRQATVTDIADELGITQGTASEHLRKIEAKILGKLE